MKIGKEVDVSGVGSVGGDSSSLLGGEKVGESGMVLGMMGVSVMVEVAGVSLVKRFARWSMWLIFDVRVLSSWE